MEKLHRRFPEEHRHKDEGQNDLFIVSYRAAIPSRRDYVNTLVRRYIEENMTENREEAYGANRFLAEQIKYFKEKLDQSDAEIIKFRKRRASLSHSMTQDRRGDKGPRASSMRSGSVKRDRARRNVILNR